VSDIVDKLILNGEIKPMILAAPDTKGKTYIGTFYTNSSLNGRWEDFITQDLVQFVERNYRAVRQSRSRGIMGVSMGGYGAIKLALKHPDIFSVVYGNVPALLRFTEPDPVGFPMWA
jgi:S-formylglutathione hydrolase FrmB